MTLLAQEVAQYLKDHPEFFAQYAELLTQLVIPDPHGGRTVSITERQIAALREQVKRLETKLAELIRFGEENDALLAKAHRLTLALAGASETTAALAALEDHLTGDFAIPHVAIRLWAKSPESTPTVAERELIASLVHPYCGPAAAVPEALAWFGEAGAHIRSLALVVLRHGGTPFGVLALGSEEGQRFYPEMGTLYLERLGEVAAVTLARTLALD
ncbi:MAG: DUF484 family protein [Rhodocyclaceae bacterium]|nr:DUF484 family protein [Rhodocyclaceae bacterium]